MVTAFTRKFFPARHFTPGQFGPDSGAVSPYLAIRTSGTGQASGIGKLLIGVTFQVEDLAQAGGTVRLSVPVLLRVAGFGAAAGNVRLTTGEAAPEQEQPRVTGGGGGRRRPYGRPFRKLPDAIAEPMVLRVAGLGVAVGAVALTVQTGLTIAGQGSAQGSAMIETTDPVTADNAFWLMAA